MRRRKRRERHSLRTMALFMILGMAVYVIIYLEPMLKRESYAIAAGAMLTALADSFLESLF